jgi:hypothetical protein
MRVRDTGEKTEPPCETHALLLFFLSVVAKCSPKPQATPSWPFTGLGFDPSF